MRDPILPVKEVLKLVGFSRRTLYNEIKRGVFPRPLQISLRRVGWKESDVEAWLTERKRAS